MVPLMALATCAALFALQHTTHALPAHNKSELESLFPEWAEYAVGHWSSKDEVTEDDLARLDERSGLGGGKLWQSGQRNDKRAPQCGGPTGSPLLQKIREHREKFREELERLKKKKGDLRMEEMDAKSIEDKEERESKLKAIEGEMKQVDEDVADLIWRPWGGPTSQGKLLKKKLKYEFIRDKEKKEAKLAAVNAELERVEDEMKKVKAEIEELEKEEGKQKRNMDKRALGDFGGPKDPKLAELKKGYSRLVSKQADILKERVKAAFIKDKQKKQERRDALTAEKKQVDEQIKKVKEEIKKLEKKGGN
ncbi:hypothetical protein QBC37DRAFT_404392 [Rhypophila decipiens]|uniref:Uncharacterized protein n=1 Tax=Rhypophila decipiens TaxID=261697 RepID=A0AAN6XYP5_9PEZI|nr:hypothetical protein QBC37DRAFT_404392 [Rhypophila decipiens]